MTTRTVVDYGALGAPSDDSAAFQAAVDAGPGAVLVPAGSWVAGNLVLPGGVDLLGQQREALVSAPPGALWGVALSGGSQSDRSTLGNLVLDGSAADPACTGVLLRTSASNVVNKRVRDLTLRGWATGVSDELHPVNFSVDVQLTDVKCREARGARVFQNRRSQGGMLLRSLEINRYFDAPLLGGHTMYVANAVGFEMERVDFMTRPPGSPALAGSELYVESSKSVFMDRVLADGCARTGATFVNCENISGNVTVYNCLGHGLVLTSCDKVELVGAQIAGSGLAAYHGVLATAVTNMLLAAYDLRDFSAGTALVLASCSSVVGSALLMRRSLRGAVLSGSTDWVRLSGIARDNPGGNVVNNASGTRINTADVTQ